MDLYEFNEKIQEIRARNGWKIKLECKGVWIITIYDKGTGRKIVSTGFTNLAILPQILQIPFDNDVWIKYNEEEENES